MGGLLEKREMVLKPLEKLSDGMGILSACCVVLMIALTVVDVTFRFLGSPVEGAIESTGFLATLVLAFAMPDSHRNRIHIGVDILTRKLPPRVVAIMDTATGTAAFVLFSFIARQSYLYAITLRDSGERSMTLQLPVHIFLYAVAASFCLLALVQAVDVVSNAKKVVH